MDKIYSFHSFLFPFAWEDENANLTEVFARDSDENIWETADPSVQTSNYSRAMLLEDMDPTEYNKFHYFNESARNLIFSDNESNLVHNFRVKNKILEDMEYIIEKGEHRYVLEVSDIMLHIFSTDIAILELKCKNRNHHCLAAVKNINEYGRRLAMPFWPENGFSKCADSLELKSKCICEQDNFRSFKHDKVSFCYVSKVIRCLLNKNGMGRVFRARQADNDNEIQIRTIVDEKMFICCLIMDKELVYGLAENYSTNDGSFACEQEADLAELMYVEQEGSYRSKNCRTLKERIYGCLYLDDLADKAPKLTSVTDQAYIKLMGDPDFDVGYFENIYTKIILLGLVQRMSVAKFSTRINKWTTDLSSSEKKITMHKINNVMTLQKQFVAFRNQYILSEITVKAEGRFLYNHIQEALNIQAEYSDIVGQITSLYELVSTAQGDAFSKWGLALSLIALELSIIGHVVTADDITHIDPEAYGGSLVLIIEMIIAAIIILLITGNIFYKRRK